MQAKPKAKSGHYLSNVNFSTAGLYLAVRWTDANVEHCGATVKQYIAALNCI